ncbi:glycosyltransferase [Shewanella frigidimarina]|uniref:glycosyltransferase n=1 Tax=Shewanella frigidimarina TaxID=56812 RepID=UPI003D7982F5
MLNITLLIDNLGSGGAQRQLVLLAKELSFLGHDVTLMTYSINEHMDYMLADCNVKRYSLDTDKLSNTFKLIRVLKALNIQSPDVLISYLDTPNKISAIYSFYNRKVKWIASERNLSSDSVFSILWRKLAYKFATAVVSNSYAQEEWLLKNSIVNKTKSKVIWNGVYDDFFNIVKAESLDCKTVNFLSLGRLSYQKYPELLLQTIEIITKNNNLDLNFSWFGDDDPDSPNLRSDLERRSNMKKLPITFYQANKSSHELLAKTNCLILTSRFEGTPNVVLEAMASGTFVIAPDIVDLPIILGDNERGFIFTQNNSDSLVEVIERFLSLTDVQRRILSLNAQNYARLHFKSSTLVRNYLEIIKND